MAKKLNNPRWWNAIELYCSNPSMAKTKLAEKAKIPYCTIIEWFKKKEFLDALWSRYVVTRGQDLITGYEAQVQEMNNGSTKAAEFVFNLHDKLEKKVHGMQSPFVQFNQINNINTEKDLQDPMMEVQSKVHDVVHVEVSQIPEQTVEDSSEKTYKRPYKKTKVNKEKRNALMKLKRRAKKVGLESLGSGRPTRTERAVWLKRLESLEKKAGIKPSSP